MTTLPLPLALLADVFVVPGYASSTTVVEAPGAGEGHWVGAPSAVADGDGFWLAYRVRRPVDAGRGVAVTLAWSPDGERVEEVGSIRRETFGAASLERPALVRRPDGGWRLYVSCATPGTKHWWIDAIDADTVEGLTRAVPVTVLPGSDQVAVKDPVVLAGVDGWRMWVCCHPLDRSGDEDRMTTELVTSQDGLDWSPGTPVLAPEPAPPGSAGRDTDAAAASDGDAAAASDGDGATSSDAGSDAGSDADGAAGRDADGRWDGRGTRVAAVVEPVDGDPYVLYDGRATAAENWFERTGIAVLRDDGTFAPLGDAPVAEAPHGTRALRYACVVPLADGGYRLFFEASRPDGAHDLRTQVVRRS